MTAKQAHQRPCTYEDEFKARVAKLEKDASAAGTNLTEVCREAGVSRATPDRWRKKTPKTIALICRMEAIVERHAREKVSSHKP